MQSLSITAPVTHRRMAARRAAANARRDAARASDAARADDAAPQSHGWWDADLPPNMQVAASPAELRAALAMAAPAAVLVAFFSPACYACRSMGPKLRQLASERAGGLVVIKVDASAAAFRDFCAARGAAKVPWFELYPSGGGGGSAGDARPVPAAAFAASMQPEKLALLRGHLDAVAPAAERRQ